MKPSFVFLSLVFFSLSAWTGEIQSMKCQGGDGPNPLTDLTGSQKTRITVFETKGNVSEFVLWDWKRSVAYRNKQGEIYELFLSNGKSRGLARSSSPLSQVKDEHDRFLTLRNHPITLDTSYTPSQWRKWSHKSGVDHLYWHRFLGKDSLFSVSSKKHLLSDQQRLEVYSFSHKGVKPHLCNLYAKKGQHYHLGEGHVYPFIFLYRTEKQ
jgi:hypothetical protein